MSVFSTLELRNLYADTYIGRSGVRGLHSRTYISDSLAKVTFHAGAPQVTHGPGTSSAIKQMYQMVNLLDYSLL